MGTEVGVMTKEEAKRVLEKEIRPLYDSLKRSDDTPTILVASMGLLAGLHRLMEDRIEVIKQDCAKCSFEEGYEQVMSDLCDGLRLEWSGSEEKCTWALV